MKISVEVAYALPDKQLIIPIKVEQGATQFDAVKASGIAEQFPEIDIDSCEMGIFGKLEKTPKETLVREGERVEIYRPLIADPKEVRKKRAEAAALAKNKSQ